MTTLPLSNWCSYFVLLLQGPCLSCSALNSHSVQLMLTDLFLILIIKLDAKSVKNLAETNNLEDTIVDGRVILK
jgi:hypothetical protein